MKKILLATTIPMALSLSGCLTTASLVGMNMQQSCELAEKQHPILQAQERKNGNTIYTMADTHVPMVRTVNNALTRLKPVAEKYNQSRKKPVPMKYAAVVVKDDKNPNASAMPCGYFTFYTGLKEELHLTDDEITGVIAHEIAHSLHEHTRQETGLEMLTAIPALATGGTLQGVLAVAGVYGANLPTSRHFESEADALGSMFLAQAGYDPAVMLSAFKKFHERSLKKRGVEANFSFLSTHPTGKQRFDKIEQLMPQLENIRKAVRNGTPIEQTYAMLEGVKLREDKHGVKHKDAVKAHKEGLAGSSAIYTPQKTTTTVHTGHVHTSKTKQGSNTKSNKITVQPTGTTYKNGVKGTVYTISR